MADGLKNPLKLFIKASRFASLKEAIKSAVNEGTNFQLNKSLHKSNTLNITRRFDWAML